MGLTVRSFAQCSTNPARTEGGSPQAHWYALYTRHQHEKCVAAALSARGFEVFLPLYEVVRKWSDRHKKIQLPVFPCYVFVQSWLDRKLDIILTPGIYGFVSFDNVPAPIPPSEIEDLRRVVGRARIEPHPFLRSGDWVKVKFGPFEGVEGYLVRRKGLTRLVLSVQMLQKSAAVEIDAALTERVSPSITSRDSGLPECSGSSARALA